jgi:hypothetical protein
MVRKKVPTVFHSAQSTDRLLSDRVLHCAVLLQPSAQIGRGGKFYLSISGKYMVISEV